MNKRAMTRRSLHDLRFRCPKRIELLAERRESMGSITSNPLVGGDLGRQAKRTITRVIFLRDPRAAGVHIEVGIDDLGARDEFIAAKCVVD